jgi:putative thioredoxin
MLGPVLEKLAGDAGDSWILAKVNVDEMQDVAAKYGIRSIPAVKLFVDGKVKDEFVGALPEGAIKKFLAKNITLKKSGETAEAEELLRAGNFDAAASLFKSAFLADNKNEAAFLGYARIRVFEDPDFIADGLEKVSLSDDNFEIAGAIQTFTRLVKAYRNPAALPADPVKDLYLSAIGDLIARDYEKALQAFIQVIRDNKPYDEEGARKACIAVFKYLGEEHEITLRNRRDFANALY